MESYIVTFCTDDDYVNNVRSKKFSVNSELTALEKEASLKQQLEAMQKDTYLLGIYPKIK